MGVDQVARALGWSMVSGRRDLRRGRPQGSPPRSPPPPSLLDTETLPSGSHPPASSAEQL